MKNKRPVDRYKAKNCPVCDRLHRKRGLFCSKACSNTNRDVSENVRDNMRKVSYDYKQTPEGIAQTQMLIRGSPLSPEDFAIEIPDIPSIDDYDFLDNFDRGEKW